MKHICIAVFLAAALACFGAAGAEGVPFPQALEDANVSLSSMSDGQSQSLMLGNGDLYGIVWEKDGMLYMRITKNDIWDARVDTSKDPPLPKVDVAAGKITAAHGAPPSYGKPYPQPRCAAALRLGPVASGGGLRWGCIRGASRHSLTPSDDHAGAQMTVGGAALESTGYQAVIPDAPVASSFHITVEGTGPAEYYVDIFGKGGNVIHKSGWTRSPAKAEQVRAELKPVPIDRVVLYTRTLDGKDATNVFRSSYLLVAGQKVPLTFDLRSVGGHLDIRKAVATIHAKNKPHQVRILHDRNVVLIRGSAPIEIEPIQAATLPEAKTGKTGEVAWLLMHMPGDVDYKGMSYAVAVAGRGDLQAVSLVTSFDIQGADVLERAIALARDTLAQDPAALVAAHERAWETFWSRSGVALADPQVQRWWYRLLYFAQTLCKPGCAPVALMPPLASDATPWHADIHHNYNAWQAFWPLPGANHAELADPWIAYVHQMLPRFQRLAKDRYGVEGACMPISSFLHEPPPADCKSTNRRQVGMSPWGLTIGMAGMTIQAMWHKHLCEPDIEYLRARIYPTLREGAKFYLGFAERCKRDQAGKILLGPSYSPEHGPAGISDCPFDIAYVHYTWDAFIQAAGELNTDRELAERCRTYKAMLGDYPTALDRQGKEVVVDWRGCKYGAIPQHNIEVPASPVFPGDQVTWFSPESQKDLFRRTILDTRRTGDNSHVMFNIAKARLSMPQAVADAKAWFAPRELPNGLIRMPWAHGTFMQETIGLVGLVQEFLLQSVGNRIRVFPCWPKEQDAAFRWLRAQGGFLVSAEQKAGKVIRLEITSTAGGTLRLLSPWPTVQADSRLLTPDSQGLITLETQKGQTLVFQER